MCKSFVGMERVSPRSRTEAKWLGKKLVVVLLRLKLTSNPSFSEIYKADTLQIRFWEVHRCAFPLRPGHLQLTAFCLI